MKRLTLSAIALTLATSAGAEQYIAINTLSHHFNATREFNEENWGIGYGVRWGERARFGLSGGIFLNSYDHWSTYVTAELDFRLLDLNEFDVYAGVYAGLAEYPNLVGYAQDRGIPTVGDHIMVAGPVVSIAFEKFELTSRCLIGGNKMDAVCGLSIRIPFGGPNQ